MAKPKKMLSLLLSIVAIASIVWILEATNTTHFLHRTNTGDVSTDVTNATPATNADRSDTETQKNAQPDTTNQNNTDGTPETSNLKKVGVEITTYSTSAVSVNGFVTGVVEDGGTCTLTAMAKSDGKVLTATHPGEANATNTTCGMTTIDRSKFHSGSWTLVLSYKSATSKGSSDPLELTL